MGYVDRLRDKLKTSKNNYDNLSVVMNQPDLGILNNNNQIDILPTKDSEKVIEDNSKNNLISFPVLDKTYDIDDNFQPDINIDCYISYAKDNYDILIIKAKNYYQDLLDQSVLNDYYFSKLLNWSQDPYLKDKEEYYRRLFLLEYIEFKHFKRGKRI